MTLPNAFDSRRSPEESRGGSGLARPIQQWRAGSRGPGGEAVGVGKRRLRATGGHRRPKKGLSTSQDWSLAFPGTRASTSSPKQRASGVTY